MSTQQGQQVSFIEMLYRTRQKRGLSKARAAAEIGTSQTTYRQWERGQRPDWDRIGSIIDHTGYSPEEVLVAIWRHGHSPPHPDHVSSPTAPSRRRQTVDYGHSRKGRRPKEHRPPDRYSEHAA